MSLILLLEPVAQLWHAFFVFCFLSFFRGNVRGTRKKHIRPLGSELAQHCFLFTLPAKASHVAEPNVKDQENYKAKASIITPQGTNLSSTMQFLISPRTESILEHLTLKGKFEYYIYPAPTSNPGPNIKITLDIVLIISPPYLKELY